MDVVEEIGKLFSAYKDVEATRIEKLPQSGSDRDYYRIYCNTETYIATFNLHIKENETFLYFTNQFLKAGLPVPKIFCANNEKTIYIQEDLGTSSLLQLLEEHGKNQYTYNLFKQSLKQLARIQIKGDGQINYDHCLTAKEFGKQAILNDLLYFKYYFLDTLKLPYDKQAILDDFETFSQYLSEAAYKYFMFRDFQSRNIMVENNEVRFIDYQGGMKGALQYDVASLLWQAKANLSEEWKRNLLDDYMTEVELILDKKLEKEAFINRYYGFVLIRLLQVLGAYGFRGLFERKAHFVSSIPQALRNLKFFMGNYPIDFPMPELDKVLNVLVHDDIIHRFETVRATAATPLVVNVCSFSYKIELPVDDTENGGGFLFDCRGILNPGRIEKYKQQTGRDKEVKDYLEQKTKMPEFLNSVIAIVDISVEDYINRGFESLMIGFGCTGGQHRSVYAADALARHLKNKFGVTINLSHKVQDAKNWVNAPTLKGEES